MSGAYDVCGASSVLRSISFYPAFLKAGSVGSLLFKKFMTRGARTWSHVYVVSVWPLEGCYCRMLLLKVYDAWSANLVLRFCSFCAAS